MFTFKDEAANVGCVLVKGDVTTQPSPTDPTIGWCQSRSRDVVRVSRLRQRARVQAMM
jgi:hypothetical protein